MKHCHPDASFVMKVAVGLQGMTGGDESLLCHYHEVLLSLYHACHDTMAVLIAQWNVSHCHVMILSCVVTLVLCVY